MDTREKLTELANNLWWSWNPPAQALFRKLNEDVFEDSLRNPVATLQEAKPSVLDDTTFQAEVDTVYSAYKGYMTSAPRFADAPRISYFCMEYGLHESLPLYAGGLGILAGDHAKAASDLGLSFTAVGLFLREGYFKQSFDENGWQQEDYPVLNPAKAPLTLAVDEKGAPVRVTVHLAHQPIQVQAWKLSVGRTTMYLLDTDFEANPAEYRSLTRRLYQNGRAVRIQQEIILGIGGLRLIQALGVETDVYHMNEGHCAFLTLELLRQYLEKGNVLDDLTLSEGERWVREQCVFTTHTPVMAGHDRFSPQIFLEQMAGFREQMGFSEHDLLTYGRVDANNPEENFTMTVLALNMARTANGVSKLHGEVARRQWHHMYHDTQLSDVPIGHVTNGIHLPTWTSPIAQSFLEEKVGNWKDYLSDPAFWTKIESLSDEELWTLRTQLRHKLIDFVRRHAESQSLSTANNFDPDALTIGFARRFAPYKRAALLFKNLEKATEIFGNEDRPVQILFAGKAHPANGEGKQLIQQLIEISRHETFRGRLIVLENYSMEIGRMLVSGCDVWLNNPRRPYEASGTSGQKVPVHGGLNLSILDGWWPEGFNGTNGWAIGHESSADTKEPSIQDQEDVQYLQDTLLNEAIPTFYDRDEAGIPRAWVAQMRSAMTTLPPAFSAERMLVDYVEQVYRVRESAAA